MAPLTSPQRRSVLTDSDGLVSATGSFAPMEQRLTAIEPFYGKHQGGIATRQQAYTLFATFDLTAEARADIRALLQGWTDAAAPLCVGAPVGSGGAFGLPPAHLTVTFGFGAGLFTKDGRDRYGLAAQRPAALVDLPAFAGDQLLPDRCGGDLSVQACADDPQTAFHAICLLAHMACGTARLRWLQSGFVPSMVGRPSRTPTGCAVAQADTVWVGDEGPAWMRGGTYMVSRQIRIALESCDDMPSSFQRRKNSGILPRPESISASGAQILRRGYSYDDGQTSGLLFIAYQKDPTTGFIRMFDQMAKFGATHQFATHTGSGLFACPPGMETGASIADSLFGKS